MGDQSVHQLYPSKSLIPKGPLKWPVLSTSVWNDPSIWRPWLFSHLERTTIRVSSSIGWYMGGLKYSLALQRHTGQTALLQALIKTYKIKRLFNYKNYVDFFIFIIVDRVNTFA